MMAPANRNPAYPYQQLRDQMDQLLTGFFGQLPDWAAIPGARRPLPVDILETAESLVLEADVPGVKGDLIDISVTGDELTLRVERPEVTEASVTYHRRERLGGAFERVVHLPREIDASHIQAELRDGVLSVTLPKADTAKPRKVKVNVT
jgi:HSP20 family protein